MATPFTKVSNVSTYEHIVDQIEEAIASGVYALGDALPSERTLMQEFDVSRPTVREALRVLQSRGLVESRQGRGPRVTRQSTGVLARSFRTLMRIESDSRVELLQFRMMLEATTVELAAVLHQPDDLSRMSAAVEEMARSAVENPDDFGAADLAFHEAVWAASGNRVMIAAGQAVAEALLDLIEATLAEGDRAATMAQSVAWDRELFEAIADRDAQRAGALTHRTLLARFGPQLEESERASLAAMMA